jgi:hypothetical protein
MTAITPGGARTAPTDIALRFAALQQKYPIVLQLLVLYVFFLPLQSVQISGVVAGISINPARFLITGAIGLVVALACLEAGRTTRDELAAPNVALRVWVTYLLLSGVYYYVALGFDVGVRFGDTGSFFRSWRGRPLGQVISLLTYGLAPYLLIRQFATVSDYRRLLTGALAAAIVVLVWYGYAQQAAWHVGLPVTGRLLYEGSEGMRLPTEVIRGLHLLRFYSLGGEPRDYGTFGVGALFFFIYWRKTRGRGPGLTAWALAVSVLLTLSASTAVVLMLFAVLAFIDASVQGFIRTRTVGRVVALGVLVAVVVLFTNVEAILGERLVLYWRAIQTLGENVEEYAIVLGSQGPDLGVIFYVIDLPSQPLHHILFGHGFGNYSSGMGDILARYFNFDVQSALEESRSYAIKMLVETGIVGVAFMVALFVRTLRSSRYLIDAADSPEQRNAQVMLRYAYLGFVVAGMIQTSFYHFILMGLIEAQCAVLRVRRRPISSPA